MVAPTRVPLTTPEFDDDDVTQICPYCGEELKASALKCRHCGENLTEDAGLLLELRDVEPDRELAAKLADWPEANLRSALEEFCDDYTPQKQKAILLELDRRTIGAGRRPDLTRHNTFMGTMHGHNAFLTCGTVFLIVGTVSTIAFLRVGERSPCMLLLLALPIGIGLLRYGIRRKAEADEGE